jgi:hypothetical protein
MAASLRSDMRNESVSQNNKCYVSTLAGSGQNKSTISLVDYIDWTFGMRPMPRIITFIGRKRSLPSQRSCAKNVDRQWRRLNKYFRLRSSTTLLYRYWFFPLIKTPTPAEHDYISLRIWLWPSKHDCSPGCSVPRKGGANVNHQLLPNCLFNGNFLLLIVSWNFSIFTFRVSQFWP